MQIPARAFGALALAGLALLTGSACTAAHSALQIQTAADARDVAVAKDAAELAPYELAMATHYLEKAWEEAGHGEHRYSVELARKSVEWTDQALVQVGRGPRRLDLELDSLKDAVQPAPRPIPPPPPSDATMPEPEMPAPILDDDDDIEIEGGM